MSVNLRNRSLLDLKHFAPRGIEYRGLHQSVVEELARFSHVREVHQTYALSEIEVTDEVCESDASIVFTQAENRRHPLKAVLVATLA